MKSIRYCHRPLAPRAGRLRGLLALAGLALIAGIAPQNSLSAPDAQPKMLPPGYLSTRGSQIVDSQGVPVRIASIGGFGTCVSSGDLGYPGPYKGVDANIAAVRKMGFNCIRADFNDKNLDDPALMAQFDQLVAACKKHGVKVIFDHHNNEATPADWGNAAQQTNGLWFDTGPGTDGTDGAGNKGTITNEKFLQNWVKMAKRWAGNPTVIGFDLDNEPHTQYGRNSENWGQGGPCDIWAMYTHVGNAIQAVNPGALIICEGFADVTDKSSNIWWTMDLTHVATKPVALKVPHKVVYSAHEYPNMRNGGGGPSYIARLNEDWGYLVTRNIAPVWIGEMGASMGAKDGDATIQDEVGWGKTLLAYMNGTAPGGPRFTGDQQPISGDWWRWGCLTGQSPNGCLNDAGQLRPEQAPYIEQMLFRASKAAPPKAAAASPSDRPHMLPAGFLHAQGSQIVGPDGKPVRLACIGGFGTVTVGANLGFPGPYKGIDSNVAELKKRGFNCIRVDFNDKNLDDAALMAQFDDLVAACRKQGVKVIFDNHNNEATPANWGNAAQQSNGLWFDTGPGTDGTDGAGNKGTISYEKFLQDWVRMAKHWKGDSTVIGFDIRNEPCAHTATPALWGGGGPTDIHAMYQAVGNAILAVNPDALIICESVINYKTDSYEGDLSIVRKLPIVLRKPGKLVYSVHEYPKEIGGYKGAESGPEYIARMNRTWGWLIRENIAPVWIGEMGSTMKTPADLAWGRTLLSYMNGVAPNGLRFAKGQQPVSGDWWCWGNRAGELPDGCLTETGAIRPAQQPFIEQLLFRPQETARSSALPAIHHPLARRARQSGLST